MTRVLPRPPAQRRRSPGSPAPLFRRPGSLAAGAVILAAAVVLGACGSSPSATAKKHKKASTATTTTAMHHHGGNLASLSALEAKLSSGEVVHLRRHLPHPWHLQRQGADGHLHHRPRWL